MHLSDPEKVLHTKRLRLEPIHPSHAKLLFEPLQAPELYRFIPQDPPKSVDTLFERYSRLSRRSSADGREIWLNYAIYDQTKSAYTGTVQATLTGGGACYIAYEVFPKFWRQGIAKEACSVLIDYLFRAYKVETVSALLDTRNVASWSLLESLGFLRIKTILDADSFKGASSDEYLYELKKSSSG
jgi:RimJ/RimL family protein N-acetyltransferase